MIEPCRAFCAGWISAMFFLRLLSLSVLTALAASPSANAADMASGYRASLKAIKKYVPDLPSLPRFEGFTTVQPNYYVRADGVFSRGKAASLGADGSYSNLKNISGGAFSLGAGVSLNKWMRTDLTLDMRPGAKASQKSDPFACLESIASGTMLEDFDGDPSTPKEAIPKLRLENRSCQTMSTASMNRASGLGNVYFDLGWWGGATPYIGFGAGVGYLRTKYNYDWVYESDGSRYAPNIVKPIISPEAWVDNQGNAVSAPTGLLTGQMDKRKSGKLKEFAPALAVMAGVAVDLTANAKMDLGYRFMHTGGFKGATAERGPAAKTHEVRVGIRYMID